MHEIQAVTFDVGGTLIRPWPSVGHIYAAVAAEYGIHRLTPEDLNGRFHSAWTALDGRAETRGDWQAIVQTTFSGLDAAADATGLFETLYGRFTQPESWQVFDDVIPTLRTLQERGFRLGLLSNWDNRLRPLLKRLALADFFEVILVSCELGCRKPDPEIFGRAAEAFELSPQQMLHVGDSQAHDVDGARNAGLNALGIARGNQPTRSGWIPELGQLLNRV
jgi:putative hydrolase of the HAD superfamily